MFKYINTLKHTIVIAVNDKLIRIQPGQEIIFKSNVPELHDFLVLEDKKKRS